MVDIITPPTTPPAMAPVEEDEDEDFVFEAGPCPLLLSAVGEVDADVDVEFKVTLGIVFLKMGPSALLLNPPGGDNNVAPPDGLRQVSKNYFVAEVD